MLDLDASILHGSKARGALTVDLAWEQGRLTSACNCAARKIRFSPRYGERVRAVELKPGQSAHFDSALSITRA